MVALAACAVTAPQNTERRVNADGSVCPDARRPLPFPVNRPDCWSDAEWAEYLDREAERAGNGGFARYRDRF
jgi:hypothetical protein